MYPSVRFFVMSVSRLGAGRPYLTAVPLPRPATPWHTAQLIWKYLRPLSNDAAVGACGFGKLDIESIVPGSCWYDTTYAGSGFPVIGTEYIGEPRIGVTVSPAYCHSHGLIFGCCLKSENHSQPVAAIVTARIAARRTVPNALPFTAHLHRPVLRERILDVGLPLGRALHPDAEIRVAESLVVAHGHGDARNARDDEQA